ncbi:hypothetical protein FOZ60_016174 [Perkinsus olseni]|uniref:Uncharacterized protein n=1 Tax=Perkinsus olseni TaxID=32597 RepID=A0A7J6N498_PEROL|nr:hypothetical protein FOZ60_016174 [Perkinsus olseni]
MNHHIGYRQHHHYVRLTSSKSVCVGSLLGLSTLFILTLLLSSSFDDHAGYPVAINDDISVDTITMVVDVVPSSMKYPDSHDTFVLVHNNATCAHVRRILKQITVDHHANPGNVDDDAYHLAIKSPKGCFDYCYSTYSCEAFVYIKDRLCELYDGECPYPIRRDNIKDIDTVVPLHNFGDLYRRVDGASRPINGIVLYCPCRGCKPNKCFSLPDRRCILSTPSSSLTSTNRGISADVVYKWVNYSDPRWQKRWGGEDAKGLGWRNWRSLTSLENTFNELRWAIRGLQYNGALMLSSASGDKRSNARDGFIKDIYIVYADDVNNPPHYLRQRQQYSNEEEEEEEEGVYMIGHSSIMDNRTYPGVIPSNNRVAIRLSTANIPNISNWYLAMDDDIFLASKLKLDYLFDEAAASSSHGGEPPHIGYMEAPPRKCPKSVTNGGHKKKKMSRYEASSCNGDRIIREYFGIHKTMGETDHIPVWVNKCIYNAGSRVFNDTGEAWRGSMTSVINPTNVQWNSFNNNLLYYLGLLRLKATTPSKFKYEIHSNTPSLCQHTVPTDDHDGYVRAMILGDPNKAQSLLDDMLFTSSSQWVNIQGPGYSDEYDPCPQFRKMVFNTLLKAFPKMSSYELNDFHQ